MLHHYHHHHRHHGHDCLIAFIALIAIIAVMTINANPAQHDVSDAVSVSMQEGSKMPTDGPVLVDLQRGQLCRFPRRTYWTMHLV